MDKELLRIVIITLGLIVMIGMVLWSFFRDPKSRRGIDFYDEGDPLEKIDDSLIIKTENDEFDIVPLGSAVDELVIDDLYDEVEPQQEDIDLKYENDSTPDSIEEVNKYSDFYDSSDLVNSDDANDFAIQESEYTQQPENTHQHEYTKAVNIPEIIQIHILALDYDGFSGEQLLKTFQSVGLKYGSMKIFEKLDENRMVKFSVASMIEPGTFPDTGAELKRFKCPGVVFFLQPGELDDPIEVFDEYIKTIDQVTSKLDGVKLDSKREPLTNEIITEFRNSLSN